MADYQNGKIYKILNNIDGEIYVGSTINALSRRMAHHRNEAKRTQNKLYNHMNEVGVENLYIESIENFPCNDVYELRAREGHHIRQIGTLNKNASCRTPIEDIEYKNNIGIYIKKNIMKRNENTDYIIKTNIMKREAVATKKIKKFQKRIITKIKN